MNKPKKWEWKSLALLNQNSSLNAFGQYSLHLWQQNIYAAERGLVPEMFLCGTDQILSPLGQTVVHSDLLPFGDVSDGYNN